MNKRRKISMWILYVITIIVVAIAVFFKIPYSKTSNQFEKIVSSKISSIKTSEGNFSQEDLIHLPDVVQKYIIECGYLGTPKMSYMKATFKNVDFKMSEDKTIKIDYVQYNFLDKPERFAFIDSSLYLIPFEGFDSYNDGVGSMKGVFGKVVNLFDQKGEDMDRACLVTFLAEVFAIPNALLQDYITWEEIDEYNLKATISHYGLTASGVFTFNEKWEVVSFRTSDRAAVDMNGNSKDVDWSAYYSDYQIVNGIKIPTVLTSKWHYEEGDSVYFNENEQKVFLEFGY